MIWWNLVFLVGGWVDEVCGVLCVFLVFGMVGVCIGYGMVWLCYDW